MAVSLPPRGTLPGIGVVRQQEEQSRPQPRLSSGGGSEPNGLLPLAVALDDDAVGSKGSELPKNASRPKLEVLRQSLSDSTPVKEEPDHSVKRAGTKEGDAQSVVARAPSRPTSSRPTSAGLKPKERVSIARQLTKLLGLGRGLRSASRDAHVTWRPYEKLLKVLGYRPQGYGRPFTEKYTLGDTLGTGGFGVVRDGIHKPDGEVFAVKVMSRSVFDDADVDALAREVNILRRLDHHQVVRFIDFYEEPQTFFLVLEKVPGGELFDRIIAEGRFREEDARDCVRSLLEALEYCHSRQIAHRDIKPENILFASLDARDRTIKLCDFGLARSVADGPVGGAPCGTPTYMAPESLKISPHGTPVDLWGVGVVTHILLAGYAPFASSRMDKLFRLIKKGRIGFKDDCWSTVSHKAKDFVSALLKVDPDARPTSGGALQHSWLTDATEDAEGDGEDLARSLAKLRVFNAKLKFRAAIHTFIACQQLQGWLSSAGQPDDKLELCENQRRSPAGPQTSILAAQQSPRGREKRRFSCRTPLARKSTGIFKDDDWRTNIQQKRESSIHRGFEKTTGEGVGLLGCNGTTRMDLKGSVAKRRSEELMAEDEENDAFSEDGHDSQADPNHE